MKGQNVYIGNSSCNGIYHYKLVNGSLIAFGSIENFEKCTYICKKNNVIYGVCEKNEGAIFSYNTKNYIYDKVDINGSGPCHISVSEDGKLIFVSDYVDGYKHIFELNEDGSIGKSIYQNRTDGKLSHMHFMKMYNDYLYAVDIGKSCIEVYSVGDEIKLLTKYDFGENIEPRHLCFYDEYMFAITEKSCKLYSFKIENENIVAIDEKNLIENDEERSNDWTGCSIKVSKDGKYVYTTIRGHNSVSVFKNTNGYLRFVQNVSSYGELPWDLELDSKEEYVLVANSASDEVCVFKRNKHNGKISFYSKSSMNAPSCILIDKT